MANPLVETAMDAMRALGFTPATAGGILNTVKASSITCTNFLETSQQQLGLLMNISKEVHAMDPELRHAASDANLENTSGKSPSLSQESRLGAGLDLGGPTAEVGASSKSGK